MQQVTVSRVDLDDAEPCRQRPVDGGLEGVDDPFDASLLEGNRRRVPFVERNRAGAYDGPAPRLGRFKPGPALPRLFTTGLPPGVGQLNAGTGPLRMNEP